MPCNPDVLKEVPLFALLDEDELAVLAAQVELKKFAPRQRIYKINDPGGQADRKSTRLNSSHIPLSRMPSSA